MTMNRMGCAAVVSLCALAGAAFPARTLANCAAPLTYGITPTGPTVQVCPDPFSPASARPDCPGDGLLRVDSGGNAVLITTCDDQKCYVDECVAPGQYKYGRKTPFACQGSSCGTYYYVAADLTASASGCVRTLPAPTAYVGGLPWGSSDQICAYHGTGGSFGCSSSGLGPVLGTNALVLVAGLLLWRARSRRTAPRA